MTGTAIDHDLELGTERGIRHASLTYGAELHSFAARRLGDQTYAEDAVQETLLRAWRSADHFDPARGTVRGWLYAILRNLLIDISRSQSHRPRSVPVDTDVTATEQIEPLLTAITVTTALQGLTLEHRQVIHHCYLRQRPHAEIAQLLGVPIGTIRSRLFYARDALKAALVEIGLNSPQTERHFP